MRILSSSLFIILTMALMQGLRAQTRSTEPILGEWLIHEKHSAVKMYREEGRYYGKLSWIDPEHQPNAEEREAALGLLILENLHPSGDNTYTKGRIFAVPHQRYYDCEVEVKGDELIIKIPVGWFTKTLVWKRLPAQYTLR